MRAEVSRIILRGPGTGQFKKLAGTASTVGYSEVLLEELPSADATATANDPPATVDPAQDPVPAPETASTATPLNRTRLVMWFVLSGSSLAVLVLAAVWWRKVRREQG